MAASGLVGDRDQARLTAELAALGVTGARIVTVPKDIDALLALSFGQVDAALVTPISVDVLREVNPQVASKFRILAETAKILRSPPMHGGRPTVWRAGGGAGQGAQSHGWPTGRPRPYASAGHRRLEQA